MTTTYQPATEGGWIGLIHSGVTLVVDPGDERDDLVGELWTVARESDPLQPLLDRLTRHGLSSTPPFALVEWSGEAQLRVIVRGDVRVTVTDGAGEHLLAGTGVSTWAERTFTGVEAAQIVVQGSTPSPVALPLVSGMVLAAMISVSRSEGDSTVAPESEVAPEPAVAQEPAPEPAVAQEPAPEPEPEPETAAQTDPVDDSLSEETVVAPARTRTAVLPVAIGDPSGESGGPSEQTVVSLGDLAATEVAPEPAVGDTVFRSVGEDTALPDQADPGAPHGDHDGETVMTSDIRALRESRGAPSPEHPATPEQASVPERATAPDSVDTPEEKPAGESVRLVLPDGDIQQLDRPVLIGRSPSVTQVSGGSMPRLVVLGTGDQDISRNHAQVALEGGTVVVTDLHSRNGTLVLLPGKPPRKLRAGEPTSVIVGTVIDLGGGITIQVDEA